MAPASAVELHGATEKAGVRVLVGRLELRAYRDTVADRMWRVRLAGLAAAGGFLAVALGIRMLASGDGVLDSSGALQQYSGTALYASMVYAGVFLLAPGTRPMVAGAAAIAFCWLVELLQLTGLPAELSEHSLVARLVLGIKFDATDLAWYSMGVLPLVLLHLGFNRWRLRGHGRRSPTECCR